MLKHSAPAITVTEEMVLHCPELSLGFLRGKVDNTMDIQEIIKYQINILDVSNTHNAAIKATREWYKKLGKQPSRYRPSAEALRRRINSGKGLFSINATVDIVNLVSVEYGFSIGAYDYDKIVGDVILGRGQVEPFEAIARGNLNIENLPTLVDEIGPFGTPTSDSVRTSISCETSHILIIVYNCNRDHLFSKAMDDLVEKLIKYCNFVTIEKSTING